MIRHLLAIVASAVCLTGTAMAQMADTDDELDCTKPFLFADGVASGLVVQLFYQVIPCLEKGEPQEIIINSTGGDAWAGYGAYNALRHRNPKGILTTTIYGGGHSAAAILFLAGDVRRIGCHSSMILHPITTRMNVVSDNPIELAAIPQRNTAATDTYVDILSARSNMSLEEARVALEEHRLHTAHEVLELGIATEIVGCE